MGLLRLNLGAGNRLLQYKLYPEGDPELLASKYIEHDVAQLPHGEIDVIHNLNETPWPWPDNRFQKIEAWSVFEHLRISLIDSVEECWRILMPGGELHVKVPYWKSTHAYLDPGHYWRGWDLRSFDFFDPGTKYGTEAEFYTPHKWRLLSRDFNDKHAQSGVCVRMRKLVSEEQWEDALSEERAVPGFVIWLNGRSGAGKSTLAKGLQSLFPHAVIVDDHNLWHGVWEHTYKRLEAADGVEGETLFQDERPESFHRDFAIECARVAKVLADQGHMVIVDMIASPQARRDRIEGIVKPRWVYVKREEGEHKTPIFDRPTKWHCVVDSDKMTKKEALTTVAKYVVHVRRKLG